MTGECRNDVAIIGMACTFPGARDLCQYWENIIRKVDAVGEPPPDWEADLFFDADSAANDRTYCKRGGYLGALADFDPSELGVMPQAVDGTEPDHFLALRAAAGALADAGYRNNGKHREKTAVVIGRGTYVNRGNTTAIQHSIAVDGVLRVLKQLHPEHSEEELAEIKRRLKESLPPFHADTAPGLVPNIISGRIANRLDLMGPNYIVDAACASSLVAVDLAMQDLVSGRCDLAIAGGVHASTTPVILVIFSQLKALSRKGQIRPFDAGADGTLLGEGVGMVVLKRLADAERDCDRVYAVLKGIGLASDGRALGLLAPRREGEELALRRAYEASGIDPSTIELMEAHGTGTLVGDAVELEALNATFGFSDGGLPRCALGSVKSMISHTMPAAGIAGLIKTALALHHKVLPPTLHCQNPNPKLELDKSRFYVNTETRPWVHGAAAYPRRAGVNAFGFGGINAHAILEEYTGTNPAPAMQREWDSELFVLSGPDFGGVRKGLEELRAVLQGAGDDFRLRNLAWTLNCRQQMGPVRLAIVASSLSDLASKVEKAIERLNQPGTARIRNAEGIFYFQEPLARQGKVAVLFPGEGAQYSNMLLDLCVHFPEVRGWFDLMDRAFENHPRGYRPSDVVYPPPMTAGEDRLFDMDAGAEAVFTGNQAMYALLEKFELRPHAFVGHSTGEHSALLAAGVVGAETREELVRHIRGVNRVFEELRGSGRISDGILLAIAGADHAVLESLVGRRDDLYFALDNCPHQVVLCGAESAIEWLQAELAGTPAICQRLPMGRAYHTPLFADFAAALRKHFASVTVNKPRTDLYSCVTAARYPDDPEQIRELASTQWASTVRFRETVNAMYQDGVRLFVECGPRGNLTGFIEDSLRNLPHAAIPANVQHRPGLTQLHHLLGMLIAHGVDLNLDYLYARRSPSLYAAETPPRKTHTIRIESGLQPLRLPDSFTVSKPVPPAVPAIQPSPPASGAVMEQYLANMQQFLANQQELMQSYLNSRGAEPVQAVPAVSAVPPRPLPFVTEVVELTPGERAVVRHRFSLERERLFQHHTLGKRVSEFDPSLSGLPVAPLTVTMEIMAEAAALLMPGKVLTGMRDFRSSRWITLEHEPAIELEAKTGSEPGAIRVVVRSAEAGPKGPIWAEGDMLFASRYPSAPAPAAFALENEHPSSWSDDRLYVDGMFHGQSFMAVRSMRRSGKNGAVASLEVLARNELIASDRQPEFLTDPVILDAAGQVVAFWSQEELLPYCDIFPFHFTALYCYQPPRQPGTRLDCRVLVRRVTDREIESDIEIVDAGGNLHYRLEGWQDRRFLSPRSLWDLRISSGRSLVGKPWREPVSTYGGTAGLACSLVEDLSNALLESSHGIWANMIAHIVLSRRERAEWDALRAAAVSKRALDWLRGRCAAKDAVRLLVKDRTGVELFAADVELIPDEWGRPSVNGAWQDRLGVHPVVSLSHSGESAVALAAINPSALVGVDLESVAQSADGFQDMAFQSSERNMVESMSPSHRREWSLRLWCAKEAVAKALGRGMRAGFQALEVTRLEEESGTVYVELRDGLADEFPDLRGQPLVARTSTSKGFILSTVVSRTAVLE